MVAAHGLAYLLVRHDLKLKLGWWLAIQIAVFLTFAPWLTRYLDHGTDYPMPRYSIRFLLAVPLEYVGGNGIALFACLAIVTFGLLSRGNLVVKLSEYLILLTWMVVPPTLMYVYSYFFQPIFGPPRYHLFIAPAYLILLAHGLTKLAVTVRWTAAAAGLVLSLSLLAAGVYDRALKSEMFASFKIALGDDGATPSVPVESVIREGDRATVWVQREPLLFERRKVRLGMEQSGRHQILEGLVAGEPVISRGAIFVDNEWRQ